MTLRGHTLATYMMYTVVTPWNGVTLGYEGVYCDSMGSHIGYMYNVYCCDPIEWGHIGL